MNLKGEFTTIKHIETNYVRAAEPQYYQDLLTEDK